VPKNIVVFDFGASTLEVTVLRADRGLFETLATTSDPSLVRVVFVGDSRDFIPGVPATVEHEENGAACKITP